MLVVAVVGLARSGKDTVAGVLERDYGFEHFDFFRDVIVPILENLEVKPTKENAVRVGNEMRAKFGMGVFGEKMVQKISGFERVVVTGARSLEELKHLEECTSNFHIVLVEAPKENRFSRRSEIDPLEEEAFFGRDSNDLEKKGLNWVIKAADYKIENSGSLKELSKQVRSLTEKILAKH